ncbi:DUF6088 family protein [Thiofilum flexile]|uniref:DUF6088 family protein n=1 Tax=Thiofilum flexile TaxID=125627 RepID=UPI00035DA2DB|nr:DUF6088 family protein [Thiofilum flexile]
MKLEARMRQSIKRRSGTVIFRSDIAALGSQTQVTHVLNALLKKGELLRLASGVYAKAKQVAGNGQVRPQASLETIIREVTKKWGLVLHEKPTPFSSGSTDEIVIETETPRISRKLMIDGRIVWVRSQRRKPKNNALSLQQTIPTKGVARYIQDLAYQHQIIYTDNPMDQWADTVTRLAGDEVKSDGIEDLLIALKRAGKLSKQDVAILAVNYLRERQQSVRPI